MISPPGKSMSFYKKETEKNELVARPAVLQEILSYHILGNQWVWGQFGCSALIFLQYLGIDASALSLTAFTGKKALLLQFSKRL